MPRAIESVGAGSHHVTENHVIEFLGIGPRALDSFPAGRCTQFNRTGIRERAHVARHGRTRALQDHGIGYKHVTSFSWSSEGYECVAATLTRLIQTRFGAINPLGHAFFPLISGTRGGFGDDRADSQVRLAPRRPRCGRDLAELFGEGLSTFERSVRQNKNQGPGRIFYRNVGLANRGRKSARELFDVMFDGSVAMLAEQFATTIAVNNK